MGTEKKINFVRSKNIGIILDKEFHSDIRVKKEADILDRKGFNVFVLCVDFGTQKMHNHGNIKIDTIPISKKLKDILFFLMLRLPLYELLWSLWIKRFINKYSIDIIHAHDLYMAKSSHKAIKSSKKQIEFVLDLHENFPVAISLYNWTSGLIRGYVSNYKKWKIKEKKYLTYPSKIIVLSEYFKEKLLKKYVFLQKDKLFVFDNSIDINLFESFPKKEINFGKEITLFYFGIIAERRGIFNLLTVFEKGLEEGLNIKLLLIGPTDKADKTKFNDIISKDTLKNHVNYIPWIELAELPSYLKAIDICICPILKNEQHESGVANKIYQYMFGEKAIIASDCLPQKQLLEKINCGLTYSNDDEFLKCITILYNDRSKRKLLGENGKSYLYKNFNNTIAEKKLLEVFI